MKLNNELLQEYKSCQELLDELNSELSTKRLYFEKENMQIIGGIDFNNSKLRDLKENLSNLAEEDFKETGEKKLLGGISIRSGTKLIYAENEALVWAKSNMPIAVKEIVDKKVFETFAKANDINFVTKEDKITICFPKEITLE